MQCIRSCALIMSWLTAHPAYDAAHRDAILRQIWTESRFTECVIGRSGAYLHQWLGPRLTALRRFSHTTGCPTVQQQLDFMDFELHANDRYRAFFAASGPQAFRILRDRYGYGR